MEWSLTYPRPAVDGKCRFRPLDRCLGVRFRGLWNGAYLLGEFAEWARSQSIAFKELYAIVAAVATWGPSWGARRSGYIVTTTAFVKFSAIATPKAPQWPLFCAHCIACLSSLDVLCQLHICRVWITCGQIASQGAGWRNFMLVVLMLHLCLQISVTLRLILAMRRIRDLDAHIATWPCSSLASSTRRAYAAGLRHYV